MVFARELLFNSCIMFFGIMTASAITFTVFTIMRSPEFGASRLGDPWISPSLFVCAVTCQKLYTSCYSVAYNSRSGSCTPGSAITYGAPPLSSTPEDDFYYTDSCNKTAGYQLVVYNSFLECLFISTSEKNHLIAKQKCAENNGRLFTASTMERFQLFAHIVQEMIGHQTWIGLSNEDTNGIWTWESGELFDKSTIPVVFGKGQPDNKAGEQHCCCSGMENRTTLLDDVTCVSLFYYICEQSI